MLDRHLILKPGGTLLFSSHNLRSLLLSPKYSGLGLNLWRLRQYGKAFGDKAYLSDRGHGAELFYAAPSYARRQTEEHGFELVERVGLRASKHLFLRDWRSPHIHYLFRKWA